MRKLTGAILSGICLTSAALADVHFVGLYHNNTNLAAQTESIPSFPTNRFLEVDYAATNVAIYFLTESPAGDGGESVQARVRLFSNTTEEQDAFFVANVVLSETNQFHDTPTNGTVTLDLWRVDWKPAHGFSGSVFYAPQIITRNGGGDITDQQYLIRELGGNSGAQWGINDFFWRTNAQAIGDNPFGLDYAFSWTNVIPLNYDYIYFNNTAAGAPETEEVPGLGGVKFLDYHYETNEPSYVYVTAPQGGLSSMQARLFFGGPGGPAEMIRSGSFYTNVVITPTNQFHGLPLSGSVTLDVWRAAFYPPSGWADTVFYAPQVTTPKDGSMWLVENLNGIGSGTTATNNLPVDPQFLYSDGPFGRDYSFSPTQAITRTSLNRDYLYHNNADFDAQVETIPALGALNFLEANYVSTTTTFYVMTDSPMNLVPGENVVLEMRTSYTLDGTNYVTEFTPMSFVQNISLASGSPFHGLPTAGSKQLDLWKADWRQPTNNLGQPVTNTFTVYYAPLLKTTAGSGNFQTDYTYLLKNINAGGPGYGTNNYLTSAQLFGTDNFGQDYSYVNQYDLSLVDSDGDGISDIWEQANFGSLTNGAAGDVDTDGSSNLDEFIADTQPTNAASFFGAIPALVQGSGIMTLQVNPSSTGRVYDVYFKTNLMDAGAWIPVGLAIPGNGGSLSLVVTNDIPVKFNRTGVARP